MVAEDWTIIKADSMIELAWSDNCFVIFKPCYISFVIVEGWDVEPRKVLINHESVIKAEAAALGSGVLTFASLLDVNI